MSRNAAAQPAPPAHVSVVRRPLGPSTKSNVVPTATSTAAPIQAVKTQLKTEDRLSKAEAKIHDLQREKIAAQNELGDLQTELRLAAQREAKLKHSLDKWEKSHAALKEKSNKLSDLQSRLGELHKVHEESKARRQKEIEELTEKLRREEEKRKHDIAQAAHTLASEKTKAREAQSKCAAIEAELGHLRMQGNASSDILQEKQRLIDDLQAQSESDKIIAIDAQKYARKIETELSARIQELQTQIERKSRDMERITAEQQAATEAACSRLEAQIDELMEDVDDIEQQHAHNLAMVAKAVSHQVDALHQQSALEKDALRCKWHCSVTEAIKIETLASERAAQIHELVAVVKQVQDDRDTAKQLVANLEADLVSISAELLAERQFASLLIEQQQEQQQRINSIDASSSFGDLSGLTAALDTDGATSSLLRAELEDVRARNTLLQEEAEELQARYLSRSAEAKAAEEALLAARSQVVTLQTSVAAKTHEVDSLVAQLSELEPLRKRLAAAQEQAVTARKEAEIQSEASRSLTASLQNARVAEKAWREERDRMALLLDQAEHFETLYLELVEQSKHLVQRHALAEEEKAALSALNSELLSHNNPNQKIMYMDRIRHELDDVKQENLGLRLQLERMQEDNKVLQKELGSYRAVDMPLSQRPRAEVTRVLRAASDHEGLLRQVSGSVPTKVSVNAAPAMVSTPSKSTFSAAAAKTPFSMQGPRFTATPLHPELQKTLGADDRQQAQEPAEETYVASGEVWPHPPLPVDTGLSPKKRRSYGNLSVHATEENLQQLAGDEAEDDTLLPLPSSAEVEDHEVAPRPQEVAVRRNRPRHTLVNSGALRHQPQSSSVPISTAMPKSGSATAIASEGTTASAGNNRRPSLATSSLGVKARRVSEIVRASTPPLASIADFSNLETPHAHLLVDAALPSPSPYGLADWTATDETSHVPGLNPHRSAYPAIAHSTPLVATQRPAQQQSGRSRYSNAQRVAVSLEDTTLSTPRARGLLPPARKKLVEVPQADGASVFEDENDSFRKGWMYDEEDEVRELPEFSIEQQAVQPAAKKQKSKLKPRGSMKIVKPGPMARTFFR
ncbi:hypothetical protein EX895_004592 [Sporisorium graminicola]|uniref:Uncharacterized protein n=1 Tax=Sporisorium graminicola TaxID=280036 RepID=A0A4U7KQ94_9BASI|nr:hypothetical protein EX895_004592 [Sporisorium graminicola]TKY86443.1 hypothetical protein EX895_004592 [Sporisorium graminicola]